MVHVIHVKKNKDKKTDTETVHNSWPLIPVPWLCSPTCQMETVHQALYIWSTIITTIPGPWSLVPDPWSNVYICELCTHLHAYRHTYAHYIEVHYTTNAYIHTYDFFFCSELCALITTNLCIEQCRRKKESPHIYKAASSLSPL